MDQTSGIRTPISAATTSSISVTMRRSSLSDIIAFGTPEELESFLNSHDPRERVSLVNNKLHYTETSYLPLCFALKLQKLDMAKILLKAGARANPLSSVGTMPLMIIWEDPYSSAKRLMALDLLVSYGAGITAQCHDPQVTLEEMLSAIVESRMNQARTDRSRRPLLEGCLQSTYIPSIRYLIRLRQLEHWQNTILSQQTATRAIAIPRSVLTVTPLPSVLAEVVNSYDWPDLPQETDQATAIIERIKKILKDSGYSVSEIETTLAHLIPADIMVSALTQSVDRAMTAISASIDRAASTPASAAAARLPAERPSRTSRLLRFLTCSNAS